ncbi:MAG: hypothetical protein ACR65X_07140 [Methylocystis sp.]|jgi:predicted house-cleaning noncanonical NTP pyrophosphatase (MazG superfamily)
MAPEEARGLFGGKTLGLLNIPISWRPPAVFISGELFKRWQSAGSVLDANLRKELGFELEQAISTVGIEVILRSSASDETIRERGQFLSRHVVLSTGQTTFFDAIEEIFTQYNGQSGVMCLVLQKFIPANATGFLSNELRLVDKPYRWVAERQTMKSDEATCHQYRLSAKQAKKFPTEEALICMSDAELLARLRSVALHFWKASPQRTLLEWCWDGNRLWLLQRDLASHPGGKVPSSLMNVAICPPRTRDGSIFRRFVVGESTPWGKLRNVSDFVIDGKIPPHRLFFATAARVADALIHGDDSLEAEIDALTGGRCVVRTDALELRFNRKRTNTVNAASAIKWMRDEIVTWGRASGCALQDVVFILHAYIPASAAAWSYYSVGSNYVRVDGLWGLADGMQFYPCDTYICDPGAGYEISATQRFKNLALLEQDGGSWQTERIDERYARHRALPKSATRDIAIKTRKIAVSIKRDVQIMWFVGIPDGLELGSNLPWFMVTPEQRIEERRSKLLHSILIRSISEIDKLNAVETGSCKVILEPTGEDIRSNEFIDAVSARCGELRLPVELRGSNLAHAYHQLSKAGVQVFSAEPGKKVMEVRQRKAFDKLVRDHIPDVIAKGGETVRADALDPDDLLVALVGKLFEEVEEFSRAVGISAQTEELSDVLEVVRGLAASVKIRFSDVSKKADEKASKRGGFKKGIILRSTEINRKGTADAQLFDSNDDSKRKIRLHSIQESKSGASEQQVPLADVILKGPREVTLQLDTKTRITIRMFAKAGVLHVETRGFERVEEDQPKLI